MEVIGCGELFKRLCGEIRLFVVVYSPGLLTWWGSQSHVCRQERLRQGYNRNPQTQGAPVAAATGVERLHIDRLARKQAWFKMQTKVVMLLTEWIGRKKILGLRVR